MAGILVVCDVAVMRNQVPAAMGGGSPLRRLTPWD